ncbi:Uncharacterised protein [Rodentibacter pneumotropicus]|uniref:Uncharacterized protein n=1 Tax=Rodentibacter pneumotropicus TaxID=758 RepID=A0A3S4TTG3_9PAST|nr:Uncharacterised protein [Rodentibacter pneumotropicus]
MTKYRYSLAHNEITQNEDGNLWVDKSEYINSVAEHITKENAYAWDMFEEDSREVLYVWREGDFENRKRFLVKTECILRFDAIELEEDDDPDDF